MDANMDVQDKIWRTEIDAAVVVHLETLGSSVLEVLFFSGVLCKLVDDPMLLIKIECKISLIGYDFSLLSNKTSLN